VYCHHFCNNPLMCPECQKRFWKWAQSHTNGPKKKKEKGTSKSFYEVAALSSPKAATF
jgi:hypothetical protein